MFEGKFPPAPHSAVPHGNDSPRGYDADAESIRPDVLREMTWSDLRARLEAARDLRVAMDRSSETAAASFDAHSARRIAAHAEGKPVHAEPLKYEQAVNPSDLANGKGMSANSVATKDATPAVPRGSK